METGKTYHVCLGIRDALNRPKTYLKGMFRDNDTGLLLTPDQARDYLMDQLSEGREVLPCSKDCDNFDYKTGCMGHPQTEQS